jgi:ATP-dependent Clp protease adaptor protein ClpS
MAKKKKDQETTGSESSGSGADSGGSGTGAATAKPKRATKTQPKPKPPQMLPPWKVLLHNDDRNSFDHVISSIVELTPLQKESAIERTLEAHETGVALLLTTHKERAELYKEQFQSKSLTVSIEPAE